MLTHIQSEETISPEDELDDPMTMDEVVTSVIASPLPLRSGMLDAQLSSKLVFPSFWYILFSSGG